MQKTESGLPEGKESTGRMKRVKGVNYMVTEGDLTLGGGHTVQYTEEHHRMVHLKPI